jgi:hypothetical protein
MATPNTASQARIMRRLLILTDRLRWLGEERGMSPLLALLERRLP